MDIHGPVSARGSRARRLLASPIATVALYLAAYLALDWLTFIHPLHAIEVTPWNPPAGLSLALLLAKGPRYGLAVLIAATVSSLLVPSITVPLSATLISGAVVAIAYTGCAVVLSEFLGFDRRLHSARDIARLIIAVLITAAVVAPGFVTTYVWTGTIPRHDYWEAAFQFWIGDTIGVIALTPLLLLGISQLEGDADARETTGKPHAVEIVVQGLSIIVMLLVLFGLGREDEPYKSFYLLFLPLIWIATRYGLVGAAWAVLGTEIGLFVALELQSQPVETVRSFQVLMLTLAGTGLFLGAVVSERRRVVQALAASETRLAATLNTAPNGLITTDIRGRIETANPAAERLLGASAAHLDARQIGEFIAAPGLLKLIEEQARQPPGSKSAVALTARRADGGTFPIELSVGVLRIGPEIRYILVIRDITLRKAAEARLREHQEELARVSRLSTAGEMASSLAHELNQPLTAVMANARGCARLLGQPNPDMKLIREGFDRVAQQAQRAGAIVNRFRDFLRDGSSYRAVVDIRELIEESLGLVGDEAKRNRVDIRVSIPDGLPTVSVDPIQIEQVFVNLVLNAIEAILAAPSARREITIEGRVLDRTRVEIAVADSGPGVPDDIARRLFDPFVSTKSRGMGLGLSISRTIVESHGGSLQLKQGPEGGARFVFTLPFSGGEGEDNAR